MLLLTRHAPALGAGGLLNQRNRSQSERSACAESRDLVLTRRCSSGVVSIEMFLSGHTAEARARESDDGNGKWNPSRHTFRTNREILEEKEDAGFPIHVK